MTAQPGFVRLMADYASDGVWNRRGSGIDLADLPISRSLRDAIAAWCADYETSEFYLEPAMRTVGFDVAGFNARGEELARQLSVELPGWLVTHRPQ